jgi:RNA polymerase sigma-70 factor (ECF subfamily)
MEEIQPRPAQAGQMASDPPRVEPARSFDEFYVAERVRLFRSVLLLTGSREEAEDITHSAFVKVLERWDRVSSMESPGAYLYRAALNLHRSELRRAWRRFRSYPADRESEGVQSVQEDASAQVLARAEVLRALRAVSREQREALVLVDFLGLQAPEAAEMLGIQPDAVRARLHRGRASLREELTEHE